MKIVIVLVVCMIFLLVMPMIEVWLGGRLDVKESIWRRQMEDRINAGHAVAFKYRPWPSSLWAAMFFFIALASGFAAIHGAKSGSRSAFPLAICALISLIGGFLYGVRAMKRDAAITLSSEGIATGRRLIPWSEIEWAKQSVHAVNGPARVVLTLRLKTLQVPQFILFRSNWLRLNVSQIAHRAFLFELIQSKIGTKESSTKEGLAS